VSVFGYGSMGAFVVAFSLFRFTCSGFGEGGHEMLGSMFGRM